MEHFTIMLPDNTLGSVQSGKVLKFDVPFRWMSGRYGVEHTRYIIKLHSETSDKSECRLFRTTEGKWHYHPDELEQVKGVTAAALIEAIQQSENNLFG